MHYTVNKTKATEYRLKAIVKKCDFILDFKKFKVGAALSLCEREFHAAGPAYEKKCSPNLVVGQGDGALRSVTRSARVAQHGTCPPLGKHTVPVHNTLWVKKNWATFLRPITLEILNRSLPNLAQIKVTSFWTSCHSLFKSTSENSGAV